MYEIGATWGSELNTDVELHVPVGDKHFRIDLFTANLEAHPKLLKEYLLHVERSDPTYIPPSLDDSGYDDFFGPLEEFYNWATKPFAAVFRDIPPLDRDRLYTLQDYLFPEQFVYTLHVAGDELIAISRDIRPDGRVVGMLLPTSEALDRSTVLVYRPNDIHMRLDEDAVALPTNIGKVYIEGKYVCFFKEDVLMTVTELATFTKITAAKLGEDVRVSRLLGVVEDEDTSRIVGLLLSYIDCENTTLSHAAKSGERTSHDKWLKQITHSLKELHTRQIV
jgi:hypothetical protein